MNSMLVDGVCQESLGYNLISISHIKSMFENVRSLVRLARKMSVLAQPGKVTTGEGHSN